MYTLYMVTIPRFDYTMDIFGYIWCILVGFMLLCFYQLSFDGMIAKNKIHEIFQRSSNLN